MRTPFRTSNLLLVGTALLFPASAAAQKHQWIRPTKFPPRLLKVMAAINQDLLNGRSRWPWLSGYTAQCLTTPSAIFYGPKFHYDSSLKKQPPRDHLFLSLTSISNTTGFMYNTLFDKYPACQFPKDGLKIYGTVDAHDKSADKFRSWLIHTVVAECEKK